VKIINNIFHRFTWSISLVLLFIFVTSIYWLANSLFGSADFVINWAVSLTVLAIGSLVILLLLLPLDYLSYRKDKRICESEGIQYRDFIRKKSSVKRELYEHYQNVNQHSK